MSAARRITSLLAGVLCVLPAAALAGCTAVATSSDDTASRTELTVSGVGQLPGSFGGAEAPDSASLPSSTDPEPTDSETTAPFTTTLPVGETVGARAEGNKLLIIGDSVTASISRRYGNQACLALVPLGWQVEVDAETSRFIDFGKKVLDKRLDAGWDSAVIFLGSNYGGDQKGYEDALHALLLRLYPRPTVLITTSLFRDKQAEVNDAMKQEDALFDNVTLLDWTTISASDPEFTGADNLHLTERGRVRLGYELANLMGPAPAQPGKCLDSTFTDDSGGSPDGPAGNLTKPKPKPKPPTTTSTSTVKTTPTSSSTPGSSSSSVVATSSSTPQSSSSVVTAPPSTQPQTSPPTQPTTTSSAPSPTSGR